LVTFGIASSDSLIDLDLQLLIETEQDRMTLSFIQYLFAFVYLNLQSVSQI